MKNRKNLHFTKKKFGRINSRKRTKRERLSKISSYFHPKESCHIQTIQSQNWWCDHRTDRAVSAMVWDLLYRSCLQDWVAWWWLAAWTWWSSCCPFPSLGSCPRPAVCCGTKRWCSSSLAPGTRQPLRWFKNQNMFSKSGCVCFNWYVLSAVQCYHILTFHWSRIT